MGQLAPATPRLPAHGGAGADISAGSSPEFGDDLSETTLEADIARLIERANQSLLDEKTPVRTLHPVRFGGWLRIAAAMLLILGVGGYWYSRQQPASPISSALLTKTNHTSRPMTVLLSDGSVVTLEANSQLGYPVSFTGTTRPVQLTGEAFFDIEKNPNQPFFVYTDKAVTKVLGTSFRIRAFANDAAVRVVVRTGRVSVFSRTEFDKSGPDRAGAGIVLTPNQQVLVSSNAQVLKKDPVDKPQLVAAPPVGPSEITFDDKPVADVLETLARLYEVRIDFNETALANCRITTTFAEETLPERLSSICQAVGATYRITNDKVEITGNGCKP